VHGVGLTLGQIVLDDLLTQFAGLQTHTGVVPGVIRPRLAEGLYPDRVLLGKKGKERVPDTLSSLSP
jgi:hypothetical protein